jgi:hypothetical protein
METARNDKENRSSDEISIKDIFNAISRTVAYIRQRWITVLIAAIIGALLGLTYSIVRKTLYTAKCTFVLEEGNKAGALGQYAGLASLAGIDINSASSGLFQGDNILELYTSRLMIEKALLSEAIFNNKKQLLIDRYADFEGLRKKWKKNDQIDMITFSGNPEKFTRTQDSLISDIVEKFNKSFLYVGKPDKKLNIIEVDFISKDELFAKEFTNKLVDNVNDFFVRTKIKKSNQNVTILQKQADSVRNALNSSIGGVALAIDAAPNANPQLNTLRVPSQRKQIDVQASTAVYSEIVKNLELAKISLRQETPLIQIIDKPVLPLSDDHFSKIKGLIYGWLLGSFIYIFAIITQKFFRKINNNVE